MLIFSIFSFFTGAELFLEVVFASRKEFFLLLDLEKLSMLPGSTIFSCDRVHEFLYALRIISCVVQELLTVIYDAGDVLKVGAQMQGKRNRICCIQEVRDLLLRIF